VQHAAQGRQRASLLVHRREPSRRPRSAAGWSSATSSPWARATIRNGPPGRSPSRFSMNKPARPGRAPCFPRTARRRRRTPRSCRCAWTACNSLTPAPGGVLAGRSTLARTPTGPLLRAPVGVPSRGHGVGESTPGAHPLPPAFARQ
jgi:hypothetical protein